ncbi:hypothetical protein ACEPAF_9158 [Sanghuangporus sanghuang]
MPSNQSDALQEFESLSIQTDASWSRFEQTESQEDLDSTVALQQAVLGSCPPGHPHRAGSLNDLAMSLYEQYNQRGSIVDLEKAVKLGREALSLWPKGHPSRPISLNCLACSFWARFTCNGRTEDLEESILLHRTALISRPEGHPDRHQSLFNLAHSLHTRYIHSGKIDDLEESIVLHRVALIARSEGHQDLHDSLDNLGSSLRARYLHRGRFEDLEESVSLHREALNLRPEGHQDRHRSLSNLANTLLDCYTHKGRVDDLEESITLHRAALGLLPEDHLDRRCSLSGLAIALGTRYALKGKIEDLDEAISLDRAALNLLPEDRPDRHHSLGSLAISLSDRYARGGRLEDLEESILLERAALDLRHVGHPDRHLSLEGLATSLWTRYTRNERLEDLEESISLHRDALALRPEGHPDRHLSLSGLALSLRSRYVHTGRVCDLEESISLYRTALTLRPEDHPNRHFPLCNFASSLSYRFDLTGKMEDLEESIMLYRDALAHLPDGHPDCPWSLYDLARSLHTRYEKIGRIEDYEESISSLSHATDHTLSRSSDRLRAAHYWATLARSRDHQTTLEAYRIAASILQLALTIRPTLSSRHDFLSSDGRYRALALDAASYAIEKGNLSQAIELLEQGRALLWSQMRGFRSPLDQLYAADIALANRLRDCSRALETLTTSSEPRSTISTADGNANGILAYGGSQNQHSIDQMMVQVRQLSQEQEEMIEEVRRIPGFEDFLRAAPFKVLQQAVSEGPVIVVPCVCIPLDKDFYADAIDLHNELIRVRREYRVSSVEYDEVLRRVMKVLWERVVSKVVQKLKELGVREGSRIWWCPTSVLSALPFHAAGPYKGEDDTEKYLLDDYISSYTPTLKSLIAARSGVADGDGRMLFVSDTKLPSAKKERDTIRRIRRIEKQLLDDQATPEAVLRMLRRARWVHFVCHGLLDEEPFNSSLKLSGGNLTLLDIARENLPNAELAFLSACHTAEQHPKAAMDELLHLSSAIQFCGFRSVIGTMWQLLDRDGPFFSLSIYMHLMKELGEGEVRSKRAAAAVREAALTLRERGDEGNDGYRVEMKAERWVNLVHIGA